jgi:hypothetical protein
MPPQLANAGLELALKGGALFFRFLATLADLACQILPGCN